jgi:hypothetical protein
MKYILFVVVLRQRLKWKSFFACPEAKKIGTKSVCAAQINLI